MNYINFMQAGGFLPSFALDQTQQQASPTFQNTVKDRAAIGRQMLKERYDQERQEAEKAHEIITTKDPRTGEEIRMPNPGAGFVSGTDPVGEFIVADAVLSKPLELLGKGLRLGAARLGNNWARTKLLKKAVKEASDSGIKTNSVIPRERVSLSSTPTASGSTPGIPTNMNTFMNDVMDQTMLRNGFKQYSKGNYPPIPSTVRYNGQDRAILIGSSQFTHPEVDHYSKYVEDLFKWWEPKINFNPSSIGKVRPFVGSELGEVPAGFYRYLSLNSTSGAHININAKGMDPILTSIHEAVSHPTDRFILEKLGGIPGWKKYDWFKVFKPQDARYYNPYKNFNGPRPLRTPEGHAYEAYIGRELGLPSKKPYLEVIDENWDPMFKFEFGIDESINPWEHRATMNEIRAHVMRNLSGQPTKSSNFIKFPKTDKGIDTEEALSLASKVNGYGYEFNKFIQQVRSNLLDAQIAGDQKKISILNDVLERSLNNFKGSFKYPALAVPVAVGASVANSPVQSKQKGGTLDFESFQATLPENLRIPDDRYDMQRYWELNGKPKDFEEALSKNMFALDGDGWYHAYSTVWNKDRGVQEWVKRKDHPTAWMENSATALNGFQDKWRIQNDPEHPGFLMYTKKEKEGGSLNYLSYFKDGGIHIKKSNKGKFTDYCGGKVTSECIEKGKHSKSAAVRKRATFAANARKWKH